VKDNFIARGGKAPGVIEEGNRPERDKKFPVRIVKRKATRQIRNKVGHSGKRVKRWISRREGSKIKRR